MVAPIRLHEYTYAEYLALEAHSPVRHEFVLGEIDAMAGDTPEHAALAASILFLIQRGLPARCRAYTSDLRVRVSGADMTTYPDATVICGETQRAPEDSLAAVNPRLLVEVTSDSTEAYDRGAKLALYQTLASVEVIVLVSHRERRVEVVRRLDTADFATAVFRAGQTVEIPDLARFDVDELYERAGRGEQG